MRIGIKKYNNIDANTMNREVNLYIPTKTSDGEGGFTTTFALQGMVWGEFRPHSQSRALLESALSFTRSARLFIRYGAVITDNYQLQVESQMYTIHSIKDVDNAHRFYEIEIYY